eukprot:Protomagalhaensia_wolfi_Nauph_80__4722@NODE_489_length_2442_cov_102_619226_g368_i0_p2_GENE_NODE_489_length_2442_cov_102_619226_g368_i0NODE_489_length_2442_cov_102_619226_g368_i0_p2_ORF_typecomplete_len255_score27_45zfCCCH/PF00642_24/0_0048zfCCCH/PF00642_24/1_1e09zfCCCH/PF00642_24/0_24zfCCCH_3/PF15663_5/0_78zfCCCH_3/PF15663_5/8_9e08Torus/PF16131_5/0_8Torus/PF16131_5/0_011Torus/PF16131_5/0_17zfCCCH_4/PF18044_1/17zfCCCH_4/PF18044_1/0_00051zfCCCH_4/PF18044_1/0_077zf_CCCH_4/PF18345_1/6_3e03zf_CCCH_4/
MMSGMKSAGVRQDSSGGGLSSRSMMEVDESSSVPASSNNSVRRRDQHLKTKMCPYLGTSQGCFNGTNCSYAHSQNELRERPDLAKTKLCQQFVRSGTCRNGSSCTYAHGQEELRYAPPPFSKAGDVCRYWAAGHCHLGPVCRHAHHNDGNGATSPASENVPAAVTRKPERADPPPPPPPIPVLYPPPIIAASVIGALLVNQSDWPLDSYLSGIIDGVPYPGILPNDQRPVSIPPPTPIPEQPIAKIVDTADWND